MKGSEILGSLSSTVFNFTSTVWNYTTGNSTDNSTSTDSKSQFGKGDFDHSDLEINTKLGISGILGTVSLTAIIAAVLQIIKNYNKYNLAGMVSKSGLPTLLAVCSSALTAAGLYTSESASDEMTLIIALGVLTALLTGQKVAMLCKETATEDEGEEKKGSKSSRADEMRIKHKIPRSSKIKEVEEDGRRPSVSVNRIRRTDDPRVDKIIRKLLKASFVADGLLGIAGGVIGYFIPGGNLVRGAAGILVGTSVSNFIGATLLGSCAKGNEKVTEEHYRQVQSGYYLQG